MKLSFMEDNNLFRWKKLTEPRTYSRQQKIASEDDIEKWLSKIDSAADAAVARASRPKPHAYGRRNDEVYGEARQLVNSWLKKKENHTFLPSASEEFQSSGPDRLQIKREWDRLLGDTGGIDMHDDEEESDRGSEFSLTALLVNGGEGLSRAVVQEEESVENVMRRMMSKEYVDRRKLRRFEDPTIPGTDLKSKLETRQERAKENRMKRQKQTEERRKQLAMKKEAEAEARKAIIEEERRKALRARQEEELIQQEMVRIRKEMMEKRRSEEEERKRLQNSRTTYSDSVIDPTTIAEKRLEEEKLLELERRQEEIRRAVQRGQQRQKTHDLRLLQRCFAAWFSVVLDRRLQLGRAAAISDWRQLRVSFHAWRDLTRRHRMEVETVLATELAIREQRNIRLADDFSRFNLLRRCFLEWRTWIMSQRVKRQEQEMEDAKRRKMAAFLEAAAMSATNPEQLQEEEENVQMAEPESVEKMRLPNPTPVRQTPKTTHARSHSAGKRQAEAPREAWQVHRGHARHLPIEAIAVDEQVAPNSSAVEDHCNKPWTQPVKLMNLFENRHKSQQKMLKEQAKRLDEQARMIEELQSQRRIAVIQDNVQAIRAQREQQKQKQILEEKKEKEQEITEDVENECVKTSERSATSFQSGHTENGPRGIPKRDPIIIRMEERAAERARIKAEREERRKEAERNKAEAAAAHAEELQRQEEEEKQNKAREVRERRRMEKQKEAERAARVAELRSLNARADEFRVRAQLKWRGMMPWKRLIALRAEQTEMADDHHCFNVVSRCMNAWKEFYAERKAQEDELVNLFKKRTLLRRYFHRWTLLKHYSVVMELKAIEFRNCKLQQIVLTKWARVTNDERIRRWDLECVAKDHYNKVLLRRTFRAFRLLPSEMRVERERERRKDELRRRVMAIVPDFSPHNPTASTSLS